MTDPPYAVARSRRLPRVVLAFCVTMLVLLLLVQGFTTKTIGASGTGDHAAAGSPLARSRPILQAGTGGLVSTQPDPGRRVALTFDDGPDPRWTPKIAAILRARHVPATFFEVGSQIVRHPQLTRMLSREGFELGNHTFTHADLQPLPAWERKAQVALTQSAFAGTVGRKPRLMRPPYSSGPDAVTPAQQQAWSTIARAGYQIVLSDYDTGDWDQPGVRTIVHNGLPSGRSGGIILMHDAGGRRAQTVAALPKLIDALRARGFSFTTVSGMEGLPQTSVMLATSSSQHIRGLLFITMLWISRLITSALTWLVFAITVLAGLRMAAALTLAIRHKRRARRRSPYFTPPVSIVVPACNEAVGIERAVRSLAAGAYPAGLEVIVVDDGSTDETAAIVESMGLDSVRLIRQANAGKFQALNRGMDAARHPIVVTVDGDTVFEPDTLLELVRPFHAEAVGAVSGNTKVGNRAGLLGRWQHIEYVMGFNLDRRAYEELRCMPTVPGAIGAYRRTALEEVRGVSGATMAEDTDLTMALGERGWHVVYAERARAWTEVPRTVRGLWRQRCRWAYGTIQAIYKHRGSIVAPGTQLIGRRALPYLIVFQVLMPLCAPLIDLFAIYSILFLDPVPILWFWLAFNAFQLLTAVVAFRFDAERLTPLWSLPLQQLLYRQVMYLVVIESVLGAFTGTPHGWHRVRRRGGVRVGRAASEPTPRSS